MEFVKHLPETALALVRHCGRKLWVRVALMGLLAFVALGVSQASSPLCRKTWQRAFPALRLIGF